MAEEQLPPINPELGQNEALAYLQAIYAAIGRIDTQLKLLISGGAKMALDLSQLSAAVAKETTVVQSAVTLIQGLVAQLKTALATQGDPQAVANVVSQIEANVAALSAAVASNTQAPAASAPAAP